MKGLTNFITESNWKEIVICWYVFVDDAYRTVQKQGGGRKRRRGPEPEVSDSEIITLSLILETWFQGHEEVGYAFIQQFMTDLFPQTLDLDRFNVRRRQLIMSMENIRKVIKKQLIDPQDTFRLVDSAPITLMTYTRGNRCESVIGPEYFGVVTSKKSKIYGLRLHATITAGQVIDDWILTPASIHDTNALDALLEDREGLQVCGDKAYNDQELEERLWLKRQILLMPLRRNNMSNRWPKGVQRLLGKARHLIETVFSTLSTTFNIQRPRGRTLAGHVTRITTCILAHTLCFAVNSSLENP